MSSSDEINDTAQIWRIRFQVELLKRGNTELARQEMIDETPDWLRNILGLPLRFGEHPIDCTCAQWYTDGTHYKDCMHLRNHTQPTPHAPESAICTCNVFMPSGESTSPICRFCGKPPIR